MPQINSNNESIGYFSPEAEAQDALNIPSCSGIDKIQTIDSNFDGDKSISLIEPNGIEFAQKVLRRFNAK